MDCRHVLPAVPRNRRLNSMDMLNPRPPIPLSQLFIPYLLLRRLRDRDVSRFLSSSSNRTPFL